MDIWEWVHHIEEELEETGQHRLAELLTIVPSYVVNDEHEIIDALIPEALSLSKKHPNSWLEVYFRHWQLQSQVLKRNNVNGFLNEAIDLLAFSHQEENVHCPQSICVVQDLASAYGIKDGPGYAEHRIAVCDETLSKIDPSWPCYKCIAAEYLNALVDHSNVDVGYSKYLEFREKMFEKGSDHDYDELQLTEIDLLIKKGELQKAEKKALEADNPAGGEAFKRHAKLSYCLTLVLQGRVEQTLDHLLPFDIVEKTQTYYHDWANINYQLSLIDVKYNTEQLNAQLQLLTQNLKRNGAIRQCIELSSWQAELAILRNDYYTSEKCIEKITRLIPELFQDLDATDNLKLLSRKNDLSREENQPALRVSIEAFDEMDENEADALTLFQRQQLVIENNENTRCFLFFIDALTRNGFLDDSLELLTQRLSRDVDNADVLLKFGSLLILSSCFERFDAFFTSELTKGLSEESKANIFWMKARRFKDNDKERALIELDHLFALYPDAVIALELAAWLNVELARYQDAIAIYNRLIALEDDSNLHWDRLIPATLVEDWALVRESCVVLGIELSDQTGPVVENMETVRIIVKDSDDSDVELIAKRTGPVSAQISEVRQLEEEQFYGSKIVFNPSPLNNLNEKDDDGDACDSEGHYTYLYRAVTVEYKPYFIFALDGVYPGEEKWEDLVCGLKKLSCVISRRSSEEYELYDDESEVNLPGIYAYVLIEEGEDLQPIQAFLQQYSRDITHKLIWPMLSEKLEDTEELQQQALIEERYNID